MNPQKPKQKAVDRRAGRLHQHHNVKCMVHCTCEDCYCRNIPLDQQDDYDED